MVTTVCKVINGPQIEMSGPAVPEKVDKHVHSIDTSVHW
jgi:hypothetical protein